MQERKTYYLYFDITQNGVKPVNPQTPINGTFEQGTGTGNAATIPGRNTPTLGQDYLKVNANTTNGLDTITQDIRGGLSYRGKDNIVLGRLDYINQQQNAQTTAKYVLNLHNNYKPNYDVLSFRL